MAPFDPSSLVGKVKDVDASEIPSRRRGRKAADNPFTALVLDSYETETAKLVPVPLAGENGKTGQDKNVTKVIGLIRAAAASQEVGVSVGVRDHSKTISHVVFLAKARRAYTRGDDENGATDAE